METLVMPDHNFWQGKRVFITGHTGFKGAWLSLWLSHMGAHVTGFSLPQLPSVPCLFDLAVRDAVHHIEGDLTKREEISNAVQLADPEIIFHLAAQSLVRDSYADPVGTYATNVMGTLHVLEAARAGKNVKAIINVTSDKCYQNNNWHWGYRENDPMGGHDPYSSSKGCAELLAASYRASYFQDALTSTHGIALASVRAGNVIGGGDWARDRIVPDCIQAFIAGKPVIVRNPHATRPWQHVLDPLSGYIKLAEHLFSGNERGHYAQAWNFGPVDADAKPVSDIVSTLVSLWGDNASWQLDGKDHPHEASYLKVDSSKARSELQWRSRLSVDQALAWSVDWYKAMTQGEDVKEFCLKQITGYENL